MGKKMDGLCFAIGIMFVAIGIAMFDTIEAVALIPIMWGAILITVFSRSILNIDKNQTK